MAWSRFVIHLGRTHRLQRVIRNVRRLHARLERRADGTGELLGPRALRGRFGFALKHELVALDADLQPGAQSLVGREKKLRRLARHFHRRRSLGRFFGRVLRVVDALDLPRKNFREHGKMNAVHAAGEHRRVAIHENAQAGGR
jgi:hypothetical protein